jgi:hypothetical protein
MKTTVKSVKPVSKVKDVNVKKDSIYDLYPQSYIAEEVQADEAEAKEIIKTNVIDSFASLKGFAKREPKAKKEKTPRKVSAYGTAIVIMCKSPNLTLDVLNKQVKELLGDFDGNGVRSAHVIVKKITSLLSANGLLIS